MAQHVRYFEDNVEFKEGPFVVVEINGFRVECELKGWHCPVMPDTTIYQFLRAHGLDASKHWKAEEIEKQVDFLNQKVKEGVITLRDGAWWGADPVFHDGDTFGWR